MLMLVGLVEEVVVLRLFLQRNFSLAEDLPIVFDLMHLSLHHHLKVNY
jgi:hypothetical protein